MVSLVVHSHGYTVDKLICGAVNVMSSDESTPCHTCFSLSYFVCSLVLDLNRLEINLYSNVMVKRTQIEVYDLSVLQLNETH